MTVLSAIKDFLAGLAIDGRSATKVLVAADPVSTSDEELVSAGYLDANGAGGGGGGVWEEIDHQEFSTTTSEITMPVPAGFREVVLIPHRVIPVSDGGIGVIQFSNDGGVSYRETSGDYTQAGKNTDELNTDSNFGSVAQANINVIPNMGNLSNEGGSAVIHIQGADNPNVETSARSHATSLNGAKVWDFRLSGKSDYTEITNYLKFKLATGDMAYGSFTLLGLRGGSGNGTGSYKEISRTDLSGAPTQKVVALPAGYIKYRMTLISIDPSGAAPKTLLVRTSTTGAAPGDSGATDYKQAGSHKTSAPANVDYGSQYDGIHVTSPSLGMGSTTLRVLKAEVEITDARNNLRRTQFDIEATYGDNSDEVVSHNGSGWRAANQVDTAVVVEWSDAGAFDNSGFIILEGIPE